MALIDKASLLFVPSVVAEGKAFNILPSGNRAPDSTDQNSGYDQTRADFDFDRGSNAAATRIGSDGLLKKYLENKLLHSGNLTESEWQNVRTTDTSGHTGYDGTANAYKIIPTTASNTHRIDYVDTWTTGLVYAFSFYAKADGYDTIDVVIGGSSVGTDYGRFNLSTGAATNTNAIATSMEDLGDGWYRCQTAQISGSTTRINIGVNDGTTQSYAGNGTSGVLIQHPQLESGLVATDYLNSTDVTGKAGVLIDLPRINYDANGENGALLLEPSRLQLFPFSEYFGGSAWDKTANGTASAPLLTYGVKSPEGLNNAYEITFNTNAGTSSSDSSVLAESISNQPAGDYTLSFYAKVTSGTDKIVARGAGGSSYTTCDLTTEWKRFEITETLASLGIIYVDIGLRRGLANEPLNSSVTCQIFGAQLEANASYATSYIPNHGTSGGVTRAGDYCYKSGLGDVIGQSEGTLFFDWIMNHESPNTSEDLYTLILSDGSGNKLIGVNNYNQTITVFIKNTTTLFFDNSYTGGADGAKIKLALGYANNDVALYINGTQIATDSSATIPTLNEIRINTFWNGNLPDSSSVKQLALFKERLTNAELATLTTL